MQAKTSMPDAVVIGRDDGHPIHVQATVHSGRRHLDLRPWRRSTIGFAPSGTGMAMEAEEIDALDHGIAELLEASDGGRQVARVVWDDEHGRRLRAEIEPFGTRFIARLGFWQRVRDTWRPADDGLVLSADRLKQLRDVLRGFRSWVCDPDLQAALAEVIAAERDLLRRWPSAGADWLTVEANRIAFHPRGIRITCSVTEQNDRHVVVLRQWKLDESLWLPNAQTVSVDAADLDALLRLLARLTDGYDLEELPPSEPLACTDGSLLQMYIAGGERPTLCIEQQIAHDGIARGFEPRLSVPMDDVPRFGRALALSWSLLAATLPEDERTHLEQRDGRNADAYDADMTGVTMLDEADATPIMTQEIESEQDMGLTGQEVVEASPIAEDDAEWLGEPPPEIPTEEGMLDVQNAESQPISEERTDGDESPAARAEDDHVEQQVEPEEPPLYVRLQSIALGTHRVALSLQGSSDFPNLAVAWDDKTLQVPLNGLDQLLLSVRALYYDALRGRRGRALVVGDEPATTIDIDNRGRGLYCEFSQKRGDSMVTLLFPASEVPLFLDAAEAALALR